MPALTLCRCGLGAILFSHVKLLNIQQVVCVNSYCVSATHARKLEGLLVCGYVVSGCSDT
jgi:hypothetical protein